METQGMMKIFHFEGNKVEINNRKVKLSGNVYTISIWHILFVVFLRKALSYLLIGLSPLRRINEYQ